MSNDYEERQERRRERLEDRAQKARDEAQARFNTADRMASVIPFGQPILVGHHSERSDRNYRNRIHNHMDKGCEALDRAKDLERRASSVGHGGISSDDPDAISKLEIELARYERNQQLQKDANKIIKNKKLTDEQ